MARRYPPRPKPTESRHGIPLGLAATRLAVTPQNVRQLALRIGVAAQLIRTGEVTLVTLAGIHALEQALGRKVPLDMKQDETA